MKAQKIKAIKYLAKIGCGCYDKGGEITEALLDATADCTPDVRKAAVEAIEDAASCGCCKKCGSASCCNETLTKRLSEMAYERGRQRLPGRAKLGSSRSSSQGTLCLLPRWPADRSDRGRDDRSRPRGDSSAPACDR